MASFDAYLESEVTQQVKSLYLKVAHLGHGSRPCACACDGSMSKPVRPWGATVGPKRRAETSDGARELRAEMLTEARVCGSLSTSISIDIHISISIHIRISMVFGGLRMGSQALSLTGSAQFPEGGGSSMKHRRVSRAREVGLFWFFVPGIGLTTTQGLEVSLEKPCSKLLGSLVLA